MSLLRKLFIIFLGVLILPTVVLMTFNYVQTKDIFENEIKLNNYQILRQAKVANDSIISQTERISQQLVIDKSIQKLLIDDFETSNYEDYQALDDAYNVMLNFMNSTQYIEEIGLYIVNEDLLLSTNETQQPAQSVKSYEYIERLANNSGKLWIEPDSSGVFWEQSSALHFVRFIYKNVDELMGFIVIRLKNSDVDRLINEMYIDDEGIMLIADQTGKIILSSDDEFGSIIDMGLSYNWFAEEDNYTIMTIDGKEYFISLVTSDFNKWKYISLVDTEILYDKLQIISRQMIVLLLFFLLVSLILSYWLSRGIYSPIQSIKDRLVGDQVHLKNRLLLGEKEFGQINSEISTLLDELQSQKEASVSYESKLSMLNEAQYMAQRKLHKYNLYRALKGEYLTEEELNRIRLEINGNNQEGCRIIIIELMHTSGDIFSFEESCVLEYFYETSTRITCLLKESDGFEGYLQELEEISSQMGKGCIIVVSSQIDLEEIQERYDYLLKIVKYKLIKDNPGLIYEKDFQEKSEIRRLPYDYHTYLNNSLRTGSLESCRTIIMELTQVLKNDFYFASNYAFYFKDAINAIIGYLYEIQYIKSQDISELTSTFASFDSKLDNIDKAEGWTLQFITNIFTFIDESCFHKDESPIQEAIRMIELEYQNDISLGQVADQLQMSVPYLSKLFKDETGINFKEYITKCKIEHAKQLLLRSDSTIQNVALAVGYNNSLQLVRMFRKMENITPTEYRQRNKKG